MAKEVKIIAHGGYSAVFPENTLQSYQAAANFNPFAIEMDVVLDPRTWDLVCFHPNGVSSGSGTYTTEEVHAQLSMGNMFPKLHEVLAQLSGDFFFLLDFKEPSEVTFRTLLNDTRIDLQRLIFGLRSESAIHLVRELNKNVETLALLPHPDFAPAFQAQGGKYFRIIEKDVTAESVKKVQELGLEAWITPGKKSDVNQPRTAGEADEAKLLWLQSIGIDGILVNDVKLATAVLKNHQDVTSA